MSPTAPDSKLMLDKPLPRTGQESPSYVCPDATGDEQIEINFWDLSDQATICSVSTLDVDAVSNWLPALERYSNHLFRWAHWSLLKLTLYSISDGQARDLQLFASCLNVYGLLKGSKHSFCLPFCILATFVLGIAKCLWLPEYSPWSNWKLYFDFSNNKYYSLGCDHCNFDAAVTSLK